MVGHLTESDGGDDRALVQRTVLARQRFGVERDGFEHGEVRRIDVLTDPVLDELRELGCNRELFTSAGYAESGSLKYRGEGCHCLHHVLALAADRDYPHVDNDTPH